MSGPQSVTDVTHHYETAEQFCQRNIREMKRKADHNKREALWSFISVISTTLTTPVLVTLGTGMFLSKVAPSALSLAAAGFTAWLQQRKPQQLWVIYRTAQRDLEDHLTRYRYGLVPYQEAIAPDKMLAERVAEIALSVHQQWLPLIPNPDGLRSIHHVSTPNRDGKFYSASVPDRPDTSL